MQKILFLDLDRTLFDTHRFMEALLAALGQAYHLDVARETAELPQWYRAVGDLRYYQFGAHVKEVLGKSADDVAKTLRPLLAREDFLYPDAHELLKNFAGSEYQLRILSFGDAWFQNFKISFTPTLSELPRDIILEAKGDFIARNFAAARGALVDDKRNSDLPANFREIWLDREGAAKTAPGEKDDSTITINSLTQVQEVL